jgi:site-specific DNA-cytosine methylase
MKALELFCGIGGFAAAAAGSNIRVAAAIDQSLVALDVYRLNFPGHPVSSINIKGATPEALAACRADFWWMSPPCQPYSIRGRQKDLDDPRAAAFLQILKIFAALPEEDLPTYLGLENVPGFAASEARARLIGLLAQKGYQTREILLCPTQLGTPMRRPRYYLAASRQGLNSDLPCAPRPMAPLSDYLDGNLSINAPADLRLPAEVLEKFGPGLPILDAGDAAGCATCFTSAYGRSYMHSGSYLRCGETVRFFSPVEIACLLHLPFGFRFAEGMSLQKQWQLLGNSLSVTAVRAVLQVFPGLLSRQRKDRFLSGRNPADPGWGRPEKGRMPLTPAFPFPYSHE